MLDIFNQLNTSEFASIIYSPNLEDKITSFSSRTVIGSGIVLLALAGFALLVTRKTPILKFPSFVLMAIVISASTLYLAGATLYLNVNSDSGGPVSWQADFEIWACGNELELRNPNQALFSKIGSSTLHEHDDRSIHVEGTVVDSEIDASVGKFFYQIGGEISTSSLKVPLNPISQNLFEDSNDGDGSSNPSAGLVEPFIRIDADGTRVAQFMNGHTCAGQESFIQMFVYHYREATDTYVQEKIVDPATYSISPAEKVPPGDCIIIEFGPVRDQTDKLCANYGIKDIDRCQQFGIKPEDIDYCTLKQVEYPKVDPNQDKTIEAKKSPVISPSTEVRSNN